MIKIQKSFIKKYLWLIILILAAGAIIFYFINKPPTKLNNLMSVARGQVKQEISVIGKVKPTQSIDLALERGGRVKRLYVQVGDEVYSGQALLQLENNDLWAQRDQAVAALDAQKARLSELEIGKNKTEINLEIGKNKTEKNLSEYYQQASLLIKQSYWVAEKALRQTISPLFEYHDNLSASNAAYKLNYRYCNDSAANEVNVSRKLLEQVLKDWDIAIKNADKAPESELDNLISVTDKYLVQVQSFLNRLNETFIIDCYLDGMQTTTLISNKSLGVTALTNVDTALNSLRTQAQAINNQKFLISQEQNQDLGQSDQQIQAQQALIKQAEANVSYYDAQLSKTNLIAPFSGKITKVEPQIGEIVNLNTPLISLIGKGKFLIEANVSESDIAKVKIGDQAKITLDAYGSEVEFSASVIKIDLSATTIEGVSVYQTTFQFDKEDDRILSGLTANIDINVNQKEDVLFLPSRYIISKDGKKYIRLVTDEIKSLIEEKEIVTGLKGSDGRTEIISGLLEGQKIAP